MSITRVKKGAPPGRLQCSDVRRGQGVRPKYAPRPTRDGERGVSHAAITSHRRRYIYTIKHESKTTHVFDEAHTWFMNELSPHTVYEVHT